MGNSVNDLPVVKYDDTVFIPMKVPLGVIIECEGVLFTTCIECSGISERVTIIRTPIPPKK